MSKDSVLRAKLYFLEKILFGRVKVTEVNEGQRNVSFCVTGNQLV